MTREEAVKIINCYDMGFYDLNGEKIPADKLADAFDMAIEALQADTVEVVRCKDCKYSRNAYPMICHLGKALTIIESGDCFCSYAERKDK